MDLLNDYGSDDNESSSSSSGGDGQQDVREKGSSNNDGVRMTAQRADRRYLQAAPAVSLMAGRERRKDGSSTALTYHGGKRKANLQQKQAGALMVMDNPKMGVMYQPVQGPQISDDPSSAIQQSGDVEVNVAFDETTFAEQRMNFQRSGQALAPNDHGGTIQRTTLGYSAARLERFAAEEEERRNNKRPRPDSKEREALVLGSDDEAEFGVWAPASREEQWAAENEVSEVSYGGVESLKPEQLAEREYIQERNRQRGIEKEQKEGQSSFERLLEQKMAHLLPPRQGADDKPCEPSTTFHGKQEFDYKGRPWTAPPVGLGTDITTGTGRELDIDHHRCFVPKKCVHRFTGHNKGVHRVRLFPRTGHLLLSAGLDGKCKVWSVPEKQVMRTYVGHTAAVRDVQFNNTGSQFVSCSFDRYLRLWNTETGDVLQTFSNGKVPYVVKFYPRDDNFFVVGCSDSKIITYDATTAQITQEYNHHLAPVNAILFVDDNSESGSATTKMVTTSDDKKVLVWEWDIGVPIKYISDPSMHSIPCLAMHPSHRSFCGQSLDNSIVVFQCSSQRIKLLNKLKYTGHVVAGYACEMAISPDGQFLVSGDGNGNIFVWDWKKHKVLQKYKAHSNGPAICCAWHPVEKATVFTCGWDGIIKMWQ